MIFIDYNDKRPIYEQVTEKIQTLILNGVLEPDSKLPSVRSLAMELSINPNTIAVQCFFTISRFSSLFPTFSSRTSVRLGA